MKINGWLQVTAKQLETAGIGTARLDCLVLLEDATGKDRAWLLANNELELTNKVLKKLTPQLERRAKHEPLAYIRGKSEFYRREFLVSKDTLEPRPESETMIELLLNLAKSQKLKANSVIVDVGTGSGALAITAKLELPKMKVYATDISKPVLKIAKQNAKKFNADVTFYQGNLLEPIYKLKPITYNLILANLPYVPDGHGINRAAMQEPSIAIFGGTDGLDVYRKMFGQLAGKKYRPSYILTESLPPQHKTLAQIAKHHGYLQKTEDDFIQLFTRSNL